jgi:hypothetical protein
MKTPLLIACLLMAGCGSTGGVKQDLGELRQPPAEAMVECPMPTAIDGQKMEDWIRKAFESVRSAQECQRRQKLLIEWINTK